jgi:hypothetical protein
VTDEVRLLEDHAVISGGHSDVYLGALNVDEVLAP